MKYKIYCCYGTIHFPYNGKAAAGHHILVQAEVKDINILRSEPNGFLRIAFLNKTASILSKFVWKYVFFGDSHNGVMSRATKHHLNQ